MPPSLYARAAVGLTLCFAGGLALAAPAPAPGTPPGFNVHRVAAHERGAVWRGGAPRKDTLAALAASAKARWVTVTLIDLRTPPNTDDRSGKAGRLAPKDEAALAAKLGLRYLPVSALSKELPSRIEEAARQGDVYMHCMYGVNRTGFAVARYARATGREVDREGLGKRDWSQGFAFQGAQAARKPAGK